MQVRLDPDIAKLVKRSADAHQHVFKRRKSYSAVVNEMLRDLLVNTWHALEGPRAHNKASKYKGVRRNSKNRFAARGISNKKEKHLGCFATEEEAARAYDSWALATFGQFAKLNFTAA